MPQNINLEDVSHYVEENISRFHARRLESLQGLELKDVLSKKNPYLFKAKKLYTPETLVTELVTAYLSSKEETVFGNWLEGLAIFVNGLAFGGRKSGINGIDLEFEDNNVRYLVTIKSGPTWGNKSAIDKMKSEFVTAQRTLRTSGANIQTVCVNGICYGRDNRPDKGTYFKYCGQKFWEFITGDPDFYVKIIEPLGHRVKEQSDQFAEAYVAMLGKFSNEFYQEFCVSETGAIDWKKITEFSSSITPPVKTRSKKGLKKSVKLVVDSSPALAAEPKIGLVASKPNESRDSTSTSELATTTDK
jgi:hypothetical protein